MVLINLGGLVVLVVISYILCVFVYVFGPFLGSFVWYDAGSSRYGLPSAVRFRAAQLASLAVRPIVRCAHIAGTLLGC